MNIRKDYIEKTKDYLKDLRKKINRKAILNEEIKILKSRQKINGGIDFRELDIKSAPSTKDISDLIITCDAQITLREAQIDNIEHDIRMYELYSRDLDVIEKKVLDLRYLESKKRKSFAKIAIDVKYSRSSVAKTHDRAIEKLAFYLYGDEAIYL
ncbi:Uncharacterised protein [[Clostridium] sordellii]|uniref:hypothetical protein n=1 Tax=Paraclostridium sordellii TaxID=1505 RepID=UPI0005DB4618|nr:hypothetical protein [Paeniclostridium sordellii]CEP39630.1 Uncharacterised protein [[Clostridium] sordellii] [Paeniclostridium sordellii]